MSQATLRSPDHPLDSERRSEVVRPHIVHVVGTPGTGGVQNLILDLAASCAGRRYRHSLLCVFGAPEGLSRPFRDRGFSVDSCTVPWPDALRVGSYTASRWLRHHLAFTFPWRLAMALRGMKADLAHTHVPHRIDLQASGVLRHAALPMVWTIHGQCRPEGRELVRWRRATRIAAEGSSAITAVADELARDFQERGLAHPDGIPVTHGGIDLRRFQCRRPRDFAWRERWGVPANAVVMGAAGRLAPEKGYEIFVRAAARVAGVAGEVYFLIAGEGRLEETLQREIARTGLERRFHLVGFEPDVPFFLGQIDVFVLSSRLEGFPIALLEALASGLPAIATSVGGVPEMLGGDGGLIVPSESEEALAQAMISMLDPGLRASFASRAREIAMGFSIERWADQLDRIYSRLLAGGRTGVSRNSNEVNR